MGWGMLDAHPNMKSSPVIRQLDEAAINRIAAGEVVERPASAVKELVENALDAGAGRITVDMAQGGKLLLRVSDDGCGMTPADLPLAVARHATSKTDGADLFAIASFGFRGEALASMGAVGRLCVTSRTAGAEAASLTVEAGRLGPVRPAALGRGTVVELRDLFHATPARLKFLRSDRAEAQAVADTLRRLALSAPGVGFVLRDVSDGGEGRVVFRADPEAGTPEEALRRRVARILGDAFVADARPLAGDHAGFRLSGLVGLPTASRGAAVAQHFLVNGRPVRDKLLTGALRAAYGDLIPRDRHPAAVILIDCPAEEVDVNVHPAKTEVRFRDAGRLRGVLIAAIRHALAEAGHRTASALGGVAAGGFRPSARLPMAPPQPVAAPLPAIPGFAEAVSARFPTSPPPAAPLPAAEPAATDLPPLGVARAQLFGTYILSQTARGLALIDMHAAHERLVYERLKAQLAERGVIAQALLVPEIVELAADEAALLLDQAAVLSRLGLTIEGFGGTAIAVRETPALLGEVDAPALMADILDALRDGGAAEGVLEARLHAILSRIACHGSIRSGRAMRPEEMNALLREMERAPFSGQCNHGRPTVVELTLADVERLFGRA